MKPIRWILAPALLASACACCATPESRSSAAGPTPSGAGTTATAVTAKTAAAAATLTVQSGATVPVAAAAATGIVPVTVDTGAAGLIVALREGGSCAGIGPQIRTTKELRQEGQTLVGALASGCGCPTGPHFTVLLEPKTSPLRARLCMGPGTDTCEAACFAELRWDLKDVMASYGATAIEFPPP